MINTNDSKSYLSAFENVYELNTDSYQITKVPNSSNGAYGIETTEANEIIFSSTEKGILNLITDSGDLKHPFDTIPSEFIVKIIELTDNSLVLGVNATHLAIYSRENDYYTYKREHLLNSDLKSIWEVPNSTSIYVSTNRGLYHSATGIYDELTKLSDDKNLLNQCIYCVLGHKEYLWLSSNKGLIRYNTIDGSTYQFTESDGLQGMEFNTNACLINNKGEFIFGGTNGFNVFHPDSITLSDYQAPLHVSDLLVNDEPYSLDTNAAIIHTLDLDYENNTFSIAFNGIDHSDPESINLRYKLEGIDGDWVIISNNDGFARYANLKPGNYTLHLNSSNADEVWSSIVKKIRVNVAKPFWQTWWFILSSLAVLSFLIWYIFRSYYNRQLEKKNILLREQQLILEKQTALQAERTRIAAEMHDDLGGGLTTIKFLGQRLLRKIDNIDQKTQLTKIVDNSQTLVSNMSEIIWAMNAGFDSLENLVAYCRRYASEYLSDHKINLSYPKVVFNQKIEFSGEKRRHFFLVFKELLHNIVKHADASQVEILWSIGFEDLLLTVKDNGVGIAKEKSATATTSNGLRNMQMRMEKLGGKISWTNEGGTVAQIKLPLLAKTT